MNARTRLEQCFECKNVLPCWGIEHDGINMESGYINDDSGDIEISIDVVCDHLKNLDPPTLDALVVYTNLLYLSALFPHKEQMGMVDRMAATSLCVLKGISGCESHSWSCPEGYEFESSRCGKPLTHNSMRGHK